MAGNFDREEIFRTWHVFRQPGEVCEVRIPKAGKYKTISGYFNDPGKLADAVIGLADEPFAGFYFTINPVRPDLLARASNRPLRYAETATSDSDITALHWLPIDLDAKRPAGISSTAQEHDAAISKSQDIRRWLIGELGWPTGAFVVADSGNGGHLIIRIDLQNTHDDVALVKSCLDALDFMFSDNEIHVDTTSSNPSRIWKLYGTMAKKGDNTQSDRTGCPASWRYRRSGRLSAGSNWKHLQPCCRSPKSSPNHIPAWDFIRWNTARLITYKSTIPRATRVAHLWFWRSVFSIRTTT